MRICAVIVAAYRAERWIHQAVASILAQKPLKGWRYEVRVGVDACAATSARLLQLGMPHWYSEENVGPYLIRNALIRQSPADAYATFDADDVMRPAYLKVLLELSDQVRIAGAARWTMDAEGRQLGTGPKDIEGFFRGVCVFPASVYHLLGGFRGWRCAADSDFVYRARAAGVEVVAAPRPLYHRRRHPESITQAPATALRSDERKRLMQFAWDEINAGRLVLAETPMATLTRRDPDVRSDELEKPVFADDESLNRAMRVAAPPSGAENGLRHSIYTRMQYTSDTAFQERLELAKQTVIPSMLAQVGCQPVRWVWFANDRHHRAILDAVATAAADISAVVSSVVTGFAFNTRDDTEDIQTVLDSDDWIAPNWLERVQALFATTDPVMPSIAYWNPLRVQWPERKWFAIRGQPTWCSMFYSIYRPSPDVHVYVAKHSHMQRLPVPCLAQPELDLVALVVHGSNMHTRLKGGEQPIRPPEGADILGPPPVALAKELKPKRTSTTYGHRKG